MKYEVFETIYGEKMSGWKWAVKERGEIGIAIAFCFNEKEANDILICVNACEGLNPEKIKALILACENLPMPSDKCDLQASYPYGGTYLINTEATNIEQALRAVQGVE